MGRSTITDGIARQKWLEQTAASQEYGRKCVLVGSKEALKCISVKELEAVVERFDERSPRREHPKRTMGETAEVAGIRGRRE